MSAGKYDIVIDQGSDFAMQLIIKDDGVARDISGYSARAHLRTKVNDTDTNPSAIFSCSVPNPSGGEILMELDNSITETLVPGRYVYDLEIFTVDTLGDDDIVVRLIQGKALVSPEITR